MTTSTIIYCAMAFGVGTFLGLIIELMVDNALLHRLELINEKLEMENEKLESDNNILRSMVVSQRSYEFNRSLIDLEFDRDYKPEESEHIQEKNNLFKPF